MGALRNRNKLRQQERIHRIEHGGTFEQRADDNLKAILEQTKEINNIWFQSIRIAPVVLLIHSFLVLASVDSANSMLGVYYGISAICFGLFSKWTQQIHPNHERISLQDKTFIIASVCVLIQVVLTIWIQFQSQYKSIQGKCLPISFVFICVCTPALRFMSNSVERAEMNRKNHTQEFKQE